MLVNDPFSIPVYIMIIIAFVISLSILIVDVRDASIPGQWKAFLRHLRNEIFQLPVRICLGIFDIIVAIFFGVMAVVSIILGLLINITDIIKVQLELKDWRG